MEKRFYIRIKQKIIERGKRLRYKLQIRFHFTHHTYYNCNDSMIHMSGFVFHWDIFFTDFTNVLCVILWLSYWFLPIKLCPQSSQKKERISCARRWLWRCLADSPWNPKWWHKWVSSLLLLSIFIIVFNHDETSEIESFYTYLLINNYIVCFERIFILSWLLITKNSPPLSTAGLRSSH